MSIYRMRLADIPPEHSYVFIYKGALYKGFLESVIHNKHSKSKLIRYEFTHVEFVDGHNRLKGTKMVCINLLHENIKPYNPMNEERLAEQLTSRHEREDEDEDKRAEDRLAEQAQAELDDFVRKLQGLRGLEGEQVDELARRLQGLTGFKNISVDELVLRLKGLRGLKGFKRKPSKRSGTTKKYKHHKKIFKTHKQR